jgi:hypothetical protein
MSAHHSILGHIAKIVRIFTSLEINECLTTNISIPLNINIFKIHMPKVLSLELIPVVVNFQDYAMLSKQFAAARYEAFWARIRIFAKPWHHSHLTTSSHQRIRPQVVNIYIQCL